MILVMVKHDMRTNFQLELPSGMDKNTWAYYSIRHITSIVTDDFLLIILTIQLINRSLQVNLYDIHNLKALHPELSVQFYYIVED